MKNRARLTLVVGFDFLHVLKACLKLCLCLLQLRERVREVCEFLKRVRKQVNVQ